MIYRKIGAVTTAALLTVGLTAMLPGCDAIVGQRPPADSGGPGAVDADGDGASAAAIRIVIASGNNAYAETLADLRGDKWVRELERLADVKLDLTIIPLREYDRRMPVLLAGDNIPDVVQIVGGASAPSLAGAVQAGVFQPLDELLEAHGSGLLRQIPEAAWLETSHAGQRYGIPAWLDNPSRRGTYIRTDLLKQAGLSVPSTIEEFLDMLRAFKRLGVKQPYQMRENFKYADLVFGAYDVHGYQFERLDDGRVVPKFLAADRMMAALRVYKTMLDEGLMSREFATISTSEFYERIYSGESGSWTANVAGLPDFRNRVAAVVPSAEIEIVPSPVGPDGHGGYGLYSSVISSYYIGRHVQPDKAAAIVRFFDWMMTPEAERFFSFGIEGQTYAVEDGRIAYNTPRTPQEADEEAFRDLLWLVKDQTINRAKMERTAGGRDVLNALDFTLRAEGRGGILFVPALESYKQYPDLAAIAPDQAPKAILDHIVRMIYGIEPIEDWPRVIEEYMQRGGEEIVREATERYNSGQGVLIQQTANGSKSVSRSTNGSGSS